jgi:hypothetical protein
MDAEKQGRGSFENTFYTILKRKKSAVLFGVPCRQEHFHVTFIQK